MFAPKLVQVPKAYVPWWKAGSHIGNLTDRYGKSIISSRSMILWSLWRCYQRVPIWRWAIAFGKVPQLWKITILLNQLLKWSILCSYVSLLEIIPKAIVYVSPWRRLLCLVLRLALRLARRVYFGSMVWRWTWMGRLPTGAGYFGPSSGFLQRYPVLN